MQELPSSELTMPISQPRGKCPEFSANIFSQMTFAWLTPLMQKGYSAPLEFRDIWALPPPDTVESVGSTFSEHWTEQMRSGARTYMQVICACKRTGQPKAVHVPTTV